MSATTPPTALGAHVSQWTDRHLEQLTALVASAAPSVRIESRGRVESAADGIARISGLQAASMGELLRFEHGHAGYVASLEEDHLVCVMLDAPRDVRSGEIVRRGLSVVDVPVGDALLGRVLDPLGRPLDGGAAVQCATRLPVERPAPAIMERGPVRDPVHTGTMVIDALFPLGRGQRELIIGDRGTGKTAIAVDALLAQRDTEMICVYVAVGQSAESTSAVIDAVRQYGAPSRTIFVVASGSDAPGLQWLAPFAGTTMAEYFRDSGRHALVVVDDLSHHAATHRELALLMHQPPGREAYPGDVFHLHARLLERAAKLSDARGGGSLTALPIAQTEAGNLSAYIPTNLISITDGQIVLDERQFSLGQLPAVNTGLSVSRVGGKTQAKVMREAVASLRLDYAQFLELEAFTRFGTEVDAGVRDRIARGRIIRAALQQARLAPQPAKLQLAVVIAVQGGLFDTLEPAAVSSAIDRIGDALASDQALSQRLERDASPQAAGHAGLLERLRALVPHG